MGLWVDSTESCPRALAEQGILKYRVWCIVQLKPKGCKVGP